MTGFDNLQLEIKWSNSLLQSEMLENKRIHWIDDNSGVKYHAKQAIIKQRVDLCGMAIFGLFGGYEFEGGERNYVTCKVLNGVRGMGFPAWAVFDKNGNGVLFY